MPPRRRSARLASASNTPRATPVPPKLASLDEQEETQDELPSRKQSAVVSSPPPQTPASSSIKPPLSEMHPSKVHPTMAAAPSSGLRLGFTDIHQVGPADRTQPSGVSQTTPSKAALLSSPFTFRFNRPAADVGLSGDARRMMDEIREEAMKIRADLAAEREKELAEEGVVNGRRIAKPRGKAGRFSAAHMAEFKKMDSIENHPSAFRAQAGKATPLTKGVKRTQSRANLDDPELARVKAALPLSSPKKTNPLFGNEIKASPKKVNHLFDDEPVSATKRVKQRLDDDASSSRPVSRDGSFLPRPTTAGKSMGALPRSHTLASLMTPTKASLARAMSVKSPSIDSVMKSTSKPPAGSLNKSATTNSLQSTGATKENTGSATSPGHFDKVKSMFRRSGTVKTKSALPVPSAPTSFTPAPPRINKPLPRIPLTTPRRKLQKRVDFTPDTKRAALGQNSPSPMKTGNPSKPRTVLGEVHYPTLDAIMTDKVSDGTVCYPDLSAHRPLPAPPAKKSGTMAPSVPGTFTFRSDHTIRFGSTSPTGFGSSPGQVSLRHVRPSIMPTAAMPGSFPSSITTVGSDKENEAPIPIPGVSHGIPNKKRHRVSDEEEQRDEEQERATKKRKAEPVPEGEALLAPRLIGAHRGFGAGTSSPKKPSQIPGVSSSRTPSPAKKKPILSASRLNMLARPKLRK